MYAETRADRRGLFVTVVYAFLAALAVFLMLVLFTGVFIAVLVALVAIFFVGSVHYFIWGRTMRAQAPMVYRTQVEQAERVFPDNFNLTLDDRERAELLGLLERSLPAENGDRQKVLRGVRERLERYGA